jgi:GNAT superfamily N-acetyltransferase
VYLEIKPAKDAVQPLDRTRTVIRKTFVKWWSQMIANQIPISYRTMKHGEETAVVDLVLRVFDEFIAPQYSQQGIAEFKKFACANTLADRFRAGNLILLAESGQGIIGVIEIRENDHIAKLFVEKSHQRKGIAKELLLRSIEICRKRKPEINRITVNSSPNAFGAYQKMGFTGVRDEKTVNGIRFIPMVLALENNDSSQPQNSAAPKGRTAD